MAGEDGAVNAEGLYGGEAEVHGQASKKRQKVKETKRQTRMDIG